jgi:hypothetical protein
LEIVDDRHHRGSTIITSQLPVEHWHEAIANPTIADAILDRLIHNAHRLQLDGPSMRKLDATDAPQSDSRSPSKQSAGASALSNKAAKGERK